jgi:hypothetical protein
MVVALLLHRLAAGGAMMAIGWLVFLCGFKSVVPQMRIDGTLLRDVPLGKAYRIYGSCLITGRDLSL